MMLTRNAKFLSACGAGALALATLSVFAVPLAQRSWDQWTPSAATPRKQSIQGTRDLGDWTMSGNSGSLNYTIDFPELPNRGEVKAKLSLSYEFGSGDGAMGENWAIETSSIVQNSDKGTPLPRKNFGEDFYANFSRDGQRMKFLRNATVDPLTQQVRSDNLVKDFAFDEANEAERVSYYDKGFDVWVKDAHGQLKTEHLSSGFVVIGSNGIQSIYTGQLDEAEGTVAQADSPPHITRWPIKFEIYPGGESVRYEYKKVGGRSYLQNVKFAGDLSIYHFDLCQIGDPGCALSTNSIDYSSAFSRESRVLYTRMQASFKGKTEQTWCMVYESQGNTTSSTLSTHPDCQAAFQAESDAWEKSQSPTSSPALRALIRQGHSNTSRNQVALAEPTLNFHYHHDRMTPGVQPQFFDKQGDLHNRLDFSFLFDVNDDRRIDLISKSTDGSTTLAFGTGNPDQAFQLPIKWTLQRRSGQELIPVSPYFENSNFQLADIDGDGFIDVVEMEKGSGKLYWYQKLPNFQFKEGQLLLDKSERSITLDPLGFSAKSIQMLDVNGDRAADIVVVKKDSNSDFVKATVWLNRIWVREKSKLYFAQQTSFNLPMRQKSKAMERFSNESLRFMDINGDGLIDFVESVDEGSKLGVCVYPNIGLTKDSFGSQELGKDEVDCENKGIFSSLGPANAQHIPGKLWILDVDGDGQLDLVDYADNATELKIYQNQQQGFRFGQAKIWSLGTTKLPVVEERSNIRIADMDGDGSEEIIAVDPDPTHFQSLRITFGQQANLHEEAPHFERLNHLTQVESNSGMRIDFQYSDSTKEGKNDPAFLQLPYSVPLLKQVVYGLTENKAFKPNQVALSRYNYRDPLYDPFYGQMMGFQTVDDIQSLFGRDHAEKHGARVTTTLYTRLKAEGEDAALVQPFTTEITDQTNQVWNLSPTLLDDWFQTVDWQSNWSNAGYLPHQTLSVVNTEQSLIVKSRLHSTWTLVPVPWDEIVSTRFWKRMTDSTLTNFEALLKGETGSSTTTLTMNYQGFDAWNLPACDIVRQNAILGPLSTSIPAQAIISCRSYAASRKSLEALSIVDAPSEECTGEIPFELNDPASCLDSPSDGTGKILEHVVSTYDPKHGKTLTRTQQALSPPLSLPLPSLSHPSSHEGGSTHLQNGITLSESDRVSTYLYDATFGNLIEERDSVSRIILRKFDKENGIRLLSEKNALNHETLYCYTDLCADQKALVSTEEQRFSLVTQIRNPQGSWSYFNYDSLGRLESEAQDTGERKDYCYREAQGNEPYRVLTLSNAKGEHCDPNTSFVGTLLAFDAFGNQLYQADSFGASSEQEAIYLHDFSHYAGHLGLVTDVYEVMKRDHQTIWQLFEASNPLEFDLSPSGITIYEYNEAGELVGSTLPDGLKIDKTSQAWGAVYEESMQTNEAKGDTKVPLTTKERRLQLGDTAYAWMDRNAFKRQAKRNSIQQIQEIALDGETLPRRYLYNSFDELIYAETPGVGAYSWQRDARGAVINEYHWDSVGMRLPTVNRQYDALGRVTRICVDGQDDSVFTFDSYDLPVVDAGLKKRINQGCGQSLTIPQTAIPSTALGRLTKTERFDSSHKLFDGRETMLYDTQGRLIQLRSIVGAEESISVFDYDGLGHLSKVRVQDPVSKTFVVQNFKLGPEGQVNGLDISTAEAAEPMTLIQSVSYGPQGLPTVIDYGNGVQSKQAYSKTGLIVSKSVSGSQSLGPIFWQNETYSRDERGLLLHVSDKAADEPFPQGWTRLNRKARYHYDNEQSLRSAMAFGQEFYYQYGPAGSLLVNSEVSKQPLKPWPIPSRDASTSFLSTGNSDGIWTYDNQGRLVQSPQISSLEYDALGHLITVRTAEHTIRFGYSALGERIYKQVEGGSRTLFFSPFVSMTGGVSVHDFWLWGSNTLSYLPSKANWQLTLLDATGSAALVLDGKGKLGEQLASTPFGQELKLTTTSGLRRVGIDPDVQSFSSPRRFGNQIQDPETGLSYWEGRYYNPAQGLFISPDFNDLANPEVCLQRMGPCAFLSLNGNNPVQP